MAPTEGEIRLKGTRITRPGPDRMMVFQEFDQLLPWKTVRQNVAFALGNLRQAARPRGRRTGDAVHRQSASDRFADAYPHTLSGGMKQRVAIARGMAMEPDILLMDEPFAALDALTRTRMQDELLALWEDTQFTVLFVTHSIAEAVKIGNRILLLSPHPGQVKAELNSVPLDATPAEAAALETASTTCCSPIASRSTNMSDLALRPEIVRDVRGADEFGIVQKELTVLERLYNQVWLRKTALLVVLAVAWELYARYLDNPLLVPTFADTVTALWGGMVSGVLPERAWASIQVLAIGFTTGVVLAGVLTVLAITTRIGTDFLETMTAMFNPLPAIALLPLALIWFGLGVGSLVFVLVHSVLWPVALNTHAGFRAVSQPCAWSAATTACPALAWC